LITTQRHSKSLASAPDPLQRAPYCALRSPAKWDEAHGLRPA